MILVAMMDGDFYGDRADREYGLLSNFGLPSSQMNIFQSTLDASTYSNLCTLMQIKHLKAVEKHLANNEKCDRHWILTRKKPCKMDQFSFACAYGVV